MMGDRKLSSDQVREIRRRYAGGNTCKILAMEYGVSTATISNYVLGVKREPADRNERVSFGGDPLPSELKGDNAANGAGKQDVSGADKLGGAADKQHGADKPCGGDKAVDAVKDGGTVPAECAGKTENKDMSGADKPGGADGKQDVSGADKLGGAADKQRGDKAVSSVDDKQDGNGADKPGGASDKDMSGEDKPENSAEKLGSAAEKQRGDTKKPGRATKKAGDDSVPDKAAEEKEGFVFSEKLTRLFDESGKTTGDLALFIEEKTGKKFTPEPIRNWCRGNYYPNIVRIPLIAEFFGVSVEYLLTDTEDKGAKVVESGADGLDACDLATGFFLFLQKNIRDDISINILRRDGVVEIKISSKDEELAFKRRVGGSGGGT